jgi:hypothetical protein
LAGIISIKCKGIPKRLIEEEVKKNIEQLPSAVEEENQYRSCGST